MFSMLFQQFINMPFGKKKKKEIELKMFKLECNGKELISQLRVLGEEFITVSSRFANFLIREIWEVEFHFKLYEYLELSGVTKNLLLTMKLYGSSGPFAYSIHSSLMSKISGLPRLTSSLKHTNCKLYSNLMSDIIQT